MKIQIVIIALLVFPYKKRLLTQVSTLDSLLIETLASEFLLKTGLPGLSLAIGKDEEIIYAHGFGYADIEKKIPMTTSTKLRTASVAKVITATAIGRLVTEGKLDLDAPIKNYVPYVKPMYANLSTRQLAGHTSGLSHRPSGNGYKKKQYKSVQESVEIINTPLLFQPDSEYKYSTNGFNLLAAVIEGASGKSYQEYMKEEMFEPLNMENTYPENINAAKEGEAQLYYLKNKVLKKEKRLVNGSYKLAGAGYRSTSIDLVKMMNAYSNDLISSGVRTDMFSSHQLNNGEKTNVGVAWRLSYDPFGNKTIEHAGSWQGARTVIVYFPEEKLSVALMINATCQIFIEEMAHLFAQLVRKKPQTRTSVEHLNEEVQLVFRSTDGEQQFKGNLSLEGTQGVLKADSDGFLKSNKIFFLGSKDDYAAVTAYGLLYLNLRKKPSLIGDLYVYATQNKCNPKEKPSLVSINALE